MSYSCSKLSGYLPLCVPWPIDSWAGKDADRANSGSDGLYLAVSQTLGYSCFASRSGSQAAGRGLSTHDSGQLLLSSL